MNIVDTRMSRMRVRVTTEVTKLPPELGFLSTIRIRIHEQIKALGQDQNGMVTDLGSYRDPNVSCIELKTDNFTPSAISQLLNRHIPETRFCQDLGQKIAHDCSFLREKFLMSVEARWSREVRYMLPPPVPVSVPSRAASDDVLQRLVDEQRVESSSVDLKEATPCSICMESLSEEPSHGNNNIIKMPECSHMFHQGCIFKWLKRHNSCPLCRRVPY